MLALCVAVLAAAAAEARIDVGTERTWTHSLAVLHTIPRNHDATIGRLLLTSHDGRESITPGPLDAARRKLAGTKPLCWVQLRPERSPAKFRMLQCKGHPRCLSACEANSAPQEAVEQSALSIMWVKTAISASLDSRSI